MGGIYTVIKTKAPITEQEYGNRYVLLGPLSYKNSAMEVEEAEPTDPALKATLEAMRSHGVRVLYGRWLIDRPPQVVLFDLNSLAHRLDEWKKDLWEVAQIPTPPFDSETNDTLLLGYAVAWFLGEYTVHQRTHAIIAQFHEWQAGLAIPLIRKRHLDVTTIFTTHATLLGRYLCAGSEDFYNNLQYFDVDAEAGKRGIYHRYCIERGAAHCADVFTTVSDITAYEAEHLLKRRPDGVTPNGLNVVKFSAVHEFQNLHALSKAKINDFIRGHFYGHYDFDLDNTILMFTAGRYEFRNKGVDMFIEALARLNARLKAAKSKMTVVAFIIMPASTTGYTMEALKGQAVTKALQETVDQISARIGQRLLERTARSAGSNSANLDQIDPEALLDEKDKVSLKRRLFAMRRQVYPPVVTHNMADDAKDPILNHIRRVQLFNSPDDRVKVIFHPEFLNSNNPILGMDYEDFVRGCHLGVFPSYYEPWGYTPAECSVMGIPSVTSNLSGFGCFMDDMVEDSEDYGIYIVDRRMKSVDESVEQLVRQMESFVGKTRRQRINQRNRTERISELLDWKKLGLEYAKARQLALRRAYPDSFDEQDSLFYMGPDGYEIGPTHDLQDARLALLSVPASPRFSGLRTPGDFGTLTDQLNHLELQGEDHGALFPNQSEHSQFWRTVGQKPQEEEEEERFRFPLAMKPRSRRSTLSEASTPAAAANVAARARAANVQDGQGPSSAELSRANSVLNAHGDQS